MTDTPDNSKPEPRLAGSLETRFFSLETDIHNRVRYSESRGLEMERRIIDLERRLAATSERLIWLEERTANLEQTAVNKVTLDIENQGPRR